MGEKKQTPFRPRCGTCKHFWEDEGSTCRKASPQLMNTALPRQVKHPISGQVGIEVQWMGKTAWPVVEAEQAGCGRHEPRGQLPVARA